MTTTPRNWLENSAMNLLVDYYPELQFRPYGTTCTMAPSPLLVIG